MWALILTAARPEIKLMLLVMIGVGAELYVRSLPPPSSPHTAAASCSQRTLSLLCITVL